MRITLILILSFSLFACGQETKSNNDYNLKGHVREVVETSSFPKHDVISAYDINTTYTLNYDDYILSIEEPNMQGKIQKSEFIYDKENIIKEINITSDGKILSKNTFIKNDKNQIIRSIAVEPNGKSETTYSYEKSSLLPKSGETFENGDLTRSFEIEYKNNLTSVFTSIISNDKTRTLYKHNSNKDLIEVFEKNIDGETTIKQYFEYKYDSKNNWIERIAYDSNKEVISTTKRKIIYW